ncbi:ATP-grasp domain-containing protein [Actinophytocola sp.]|uniref:ATP-grasp domain-containing protein n=1 Tax=Actinophytocola sp. TaxID=1872138 RepID=UPI002D7FE487|nr:ATP-grasp domain-containing protein [Actinophytocola sp.]HET9140734.1 ATP-grasp domain-containing protein [Actinophytocola sp.]
MNPDRTLLLVGHPTEAVQIAKSFGLDVILVQHPSKLDLAQVELADAVLVVDYTDWSVVGPLAEAARQVWGFAATVSLTDPGQDATSRINDRYGLPGTGNEVYRLLRDKLAMRRHLAGVDGVLQVGAEPVTDRDSLTAFGDRYGYPFIVKPLDLGGSFGVMRVRGPADAERVWGQIHRLRETGVDRGPRALFTIGEFFMEEFLPGIEYTVEGFSFAGRHIIAAVTEKVLDEAHFAELGHALPARISATEEAEIVAATVRFLDAIGLRDGPSHTEVRVSERGVGIIESHNRIGGSHINRLVEAGYGVNLMRNAIGWPFGLVEPLAERPAPIGAGCTKLLQAPPGRIAAIDGFDEVRTHPDLLAAELTAKPGDVVRPVENNWDLVGLIAVRGPNTEAAVKLCEDLAEKHFRVRLEES